MSVSLLQQLAEVLGLSAMAASRPALTFFLVQLAMSIGVRAEWTSLPPWLAWSTSFVAIAFGLVFALIELLTAHIEDLGELAEELGLMRLAGVLSSFTVSLLLVAAGVPEAEVLAAAPVITDPASQDFVTTLAIAHESTAPVWLQVTAVTLGVTLNLGLSWVRRVVLRAVYSVGIGGVWAWVETGGVLVVLALLPLMPLMVFALLGIVIVSLAVASGVMVARSRAADAAARTPCVHCDHLLRVEARRCPSCHGAVEPALWREEPRRGLRSLVARPTS